MKKPSTTFDSENLEFATAYEYVTKTSHCVFLTGKAGTGKTTFLKHLKQNCTKNIAVLAPTGIAALNAGGQTLHSFFKLPFGPTAPGDRRFLSSATIRKFGLPNPELNIFSFLKYNSNRIKMLESVDTLVIDEVSMMRADTLDTIDQILRIYLRKPSLPFGGKQVVLIGDPFQLPPVVDDNDAEILRNFYPSFEFFNSNIFQHLVKKDRLVSFELKKVYRQSDQQFINLLNRIRKATATPEDISLLNSRCKRQHPAGNDQVVEITSHNYRAAHTNAARLEALEAEEFRYYAKTEGKINTSQLPCEHELVLKEGAQVVFVKNDRQANRYVNGSVGLVKYLAKDAIVVDLEGEDIEVPLETWQNIKYTWSNKQKKTTAEVLGFFTQYPLRLAWSITVHKSQGLTLKRVFADLENSFVAGQVYVALSRCATLEGLYLKSPIKESAIRTSKKARDFVSSITQLAQAQENMGLAKAEHLYLQAFAALRNGRLDDCKRLYNKAISFARIPSIADLERRCKLVYQHKLQKQKNCPQKAQHFTGSFTLEEQVTQPDDLGELMRLLDQKQKKYPEVNFGSLIVLLKSGAKLKSLTKQYHIDDTTKGILEKIAIIF